MRKFICLIMTIVIIICSVIGVDFSTYASDNYSIEVIDINDTITLGTYNGEPISWRCVAIDENGPLMLSDDIICNKEYDAIGENKEFHSDSWGYVRKNNGSNNWQDSNIRQWLNSYGKIEYTHCPPSYELEDGFMSYFSSAELALVKEVTHKVTVVKYDSTRSNHCDGGDSDSFNINPIPKDFDINKYYHKKVNDKFMLLDANQVQNIYYNNPEFLKCNSRYFVACIKGNNYACFDNTTTFDPNSTNISNYYTASYSFGIRPAFYLNTDEYKNSLDDLKTGNLYLKNGTLDNYTKLDPKWFLKDSSSYNHDIATFCSLMNVQSYDESEKNITLSLNELNFSKIEYHHGNDKDDNGYIIASRKILVSNEIYNLVFVDCIGTRENEQWNSNFDPYGLDTDHFSSKSPNHVGFNDAKNYVYSALINYLGDNYTKENTKIVLTGHSRGAAAANLMAAQMIDNYEKNSNSAIVKPENLFTYTFASPNPTRDTNRKNPKYNRIYNIVNPQDFVTKVMLQSWGYGRYGTTYSLPTKTNDYNYDIYKLNMLKYFKEMQQANGESQNYNDYESGEDEVYNLVRTMSINVKNLDEYYTKYDYFFASQKVTPFAYFQDALCPMVNGGDMITAGAYLAKSATSNSLFGTISRFFISKGNGVLKNNFQHAHSMATYSAYMLSLNSNNIKYRKGHKGTVNCPVDVEIYDNSTGELVGQIINNNVNEELLEKEHSVVMTVDGDEKSFWLPSNGNYRVVLTGNDEGNMDYTLSKVDSDTGELERANYYNVPLNNGESYTCEVETENELQEVKLETENAEVVEPDEHFSTENIQSYAVNTSVEGSGYAPEAINIDSGDYITLEASPICSDFIGWYDVDGELITTDLEYRFRPTEDTNLIAKYSEAKYHNYVKSEIMPTCEDDGFDMYECENCESAYYENYIESIGHKYHFQSSLAGCQKKLKYECVDCEEQTTILLSEIEDMWQDEYVNKIISRKDNSCYLDVVPDGIINAKDYAMLKHLKKYNN